MDIEIDDILNKKPKKIKSGSKGKRKERELVNLLNNRFNKLLNGSFFSRNIGSGNRWGQKVTLTAEANQVFSGDLVCPANFKFVIESKGGYNDIDLNTCFSKGCKEIDTFMKQVEEDSKRCGRLPLLIWKKDRKDGVAFLKTELIKNLNFDYILKYRDWSGIGFDSLLNLPDDFFFKGDV